MSQPTPHAASSWTHVAQLCAMAFVLMLTYAIARPAAESLFLSTYGSKRLPYVWLAVAVAVVLVVGIYNRYVSQMGLLALKERVLLLISASLALLLMAHHNNLPGSTFALYIWKDVYIVVIIEMFWSYANSIFPIKTAKWTYGLFCVMGSLGGILGGRNVGALAKAWGTREVMWLLIPLFLILLVQCRIASKTIGELHPDQKEQTDLSSGLRVLFKSQYLGYLLALIIVIQIAVTLIDYQYNRILEVTYTTTSSRTYIIGQIYAAIDMASLVLQLMTGVILRYIGVPLTLLGIPLLLGVAVGSFLAWPTFLALAIAKITSKSTGYSLFRSAKEILYIPLTYEEKTQGKAVIDILSYRFAKGLASLLLMLILFFQLIAPSEQLLPSALFAESLTTIVALANSSLVTVCTSLLLAVWIWLTLLIVRRYRLKVSLEQEREQS